MHVIEIDSKVLKKSLNFLKKTLNFLKNTLNYFKKTLKNLKKTLKNLKKTLNFLKKTLNFFKKTLNYLKKLSTFSKKLSDWEFADAESFLLAPKFIQHLLGLLHWCHKWSKCVIFKIISNDRSTSKILNLFQFMRRYRNNILKIDQKAYQVKVEVLLLHSV